MKTIGFVDYYISEWHANNYIGWIKDVCEKEGKDFSVKYGYSELEDSAFDGRSATQWFKDYNVERCATIKELCEKSDYIMVLAPSDPQTHLKYAEEVFKYCNGKNVYIDKTFAPDLKTAEKIYELAEKYGVKFFSTSALRYADEIKDFNDPNHPEFHHAKNVMVTFGGGNFPEYVVHPLEIAVQVVGIGAKEIKVEGVSRQSIAYVKYDDGRSIILVYAPYYDFIIDAVERDDLHCMQRPVKTAVFPKLLSDVLRFYETGKVSFDKEQTLEIMKIREGAVKAFNDQGKWIKL